MSDDSNSTLSEWAFECHYRLALSARNQGRLREARDRYLLLFDRGRGVGGFGVARLSFVLDDLPAVLEELAAQEATEKAASETVEPAVRGKGGAAPGETLERVLEEARKSALAGALEKAKKNALEPLRSRRDRAAAALLSGKGGFVEAQELVALDRVLRQPAATRAVYDRLDPSARGQASARRELGNLIWQDLAPHEPAELAAAARQDAELWARIAGLARNVARWIGEHRMRTDFPGDDWAYRDRYLRWLGSRIERQGLVAYTLLLHLDGVEAPQTHPDQPPAAVLAQRLRYWLLAYKPDDEMVAWLAHAADSAGKEALAEALGQKGLSPPGEDPSGSSAEPSSASAGKATSPVSVSCALRSRSWT